MFKMRFENVRQFKQNLRSAEVKHRLTQPGLSMAAKGCLTEQKDYAPRWKGHIQQSLEIKYPAQKPWKEIEVGHANFAPHYAVFMEFGTGRMHLNENYSLAPNKPHWVPVRKVWAWSKDKGKNPYTVARTISKRGGLRARQYIHSGYKFLQREDAWRMINAFAKAEVEI